MNKLHKSLHIPLAHPCFAGHFPGNPIVPGALLLQWLQTLVEGVYPDQQLIEVASIKFLAEVKPGDHMDVMIGPLNPNGKVSISAQAELGMVCKAVFLMRAAEVA